MNTAITFSLAALRDRLAERIRRVLTDDGMTLSAVLVPIVDGLSGQQLLLTKRTNRVEHHKGQISFPGGAVCSADASVSDTALREANEEIGLPALSVEILGLLDDVRVPTGFLVTPVVGYIRRLPTLVVNNDEVAEVLLLPLASFLDSSKRRTQIVLRDGEEQTVYSYDVGPEPVWGATALLIKQLLTLADPVADQSKR